MSQQPDSMTSASFVNQNWDTKVTSLNFNEFTKVDTKIYIYKNDDFDTYEDYLSGSEASAKVDEDTDYLTTSVLQAFQGYISIYDDYAIRIKLGTETQITAANQAIGVCLSHEDYGTSCATASSSDGSSIDQFRTYYFNDSAAIVDAIKDDSPLDLWSSDYDSDMIDDFYFGLTQYQIEMASAFDMVADKFQYKEVSNESQWNNVKDYRWQAGDTISIYRLQQQANGSLVWDWDEDRTLKGAVQSIAGSTVALTLALASYLVF